MVKNKRKKKQKNRLKSCLVDFPIFFSVILSTFQSNDFKQYLGSKKMSLKQFSFVNCTIYVYIKRIDFFPIY